MNRFVETVEIDLSVSGHFEENGVSYVGTYLSTPHPQFLWVGGLLVNQILTAANTHTFCEVV